ncbi:hypothetical protein FKP32DRAFT_932344 [Trametes sanguinea]|nr:hypothetical protein FKP32DRAFT_932344 [Trametes sanguinea]
MADPEAEFNAFGHDIGQLDVKYCTIRQCALSLLKRIPMLRNMHTVHLRFLSIQRDVWERGQPAIVQWMLQHVPSLRAVHIHVPKGESQRHPQLPKALFSIITPNPLRKSAPNGPISTACLETLTVHADFSTGAQGWWESAMRSRLPGTVFTLDTAD